MTQSSTKKCHKMSTESKYFPLQKRNYYSFKIEGNTAIFGENQREGEIRIINDILTEIKKIFSTSPMKRKFWMIEVINGIFCVHILGCIAKPKSILIRRHIIVNKEVELEMKDELENEPKPIPFDRAVKQYMEFAINSSLSYGYEDNVHKFEKYEETLKAKCEKQQKTQEKAKGDQT